MIASKLIVLLRRCLSDLFLAGTGVSDAAPTQPGLEFSQQENRLHFEMDRGCVGRSIGESLTPNSVNGLHGLTLEELGALTVEELLTLRIGDWYDQVKVPGFGVTPRSNRFHF